MRIHFLTTLILLFFSTALSGQIKVLPWQMHEGNEGIVTFTTTSHGDPAAYTQAKIPSSDDPNWEEAPLKDGQVYISRSSTLRCKQELDFLYFQTEVFVPANMNVDDFTISYDKADDGARIYFFNSKHPNGHFNPAADLYLKSGTKVDPVNLKSEVVAGEVNRVVIVQYDNCATGNNINGIRIKVNGTEIKTTKDIVMDVCGNEYTTVKYGNQIWLQENLRAPTCSACPGLEYVKLENHPSKNGHFYVADKPFYAYYNNNEADKDPHSDKQFGAMFNFAAIESCDICPEGFRIPTTRDWEALMTNVGETVKLITRDPENGNRAFMYIAGRADAYGSVVRGRFVQYWAAGTDPAASNKGQLFYIDNKGNARIGSEDKRIASYVRCVKSATPQVPERFKLHAYSTHGSSSNADHWMGWLSNDEAEWAKILQNASAVGANIMQVRKVVADDVADIVYLQVENYPGGGEYFLTVDPRDGNKVKIKSGKSQEAKFRLKPALQTEKPGSDYVSFESVLRPNHFLRHMGYKMYLHEATPQNMANKVYIEDASWLFQRL